jgi:hypothetical protein
VFVVDAHGDRRPSNEAVEEKIYLLSHIRTNDFVVVAAHELAHDMLREQHAQFDGVPAWIEEGICQYVGAMVASRINATNELFTIQHMDDPVYGDGYAYFKIRFGDNGWQELRSWIERTDLRKLPSKAPRLVP